MKQFILIIILVSIISCNNEKKTGIVTDAADYDQYLSTDINETFNIAKYEMEFWSNRLRPDSSGVGDLGPLAGAYTTMFKTTGESKYLRDAETLYKKAVAISAHNKDSYSRSLALNYISQHRFVEAKEILEESYVGVSNKRATELMLFDVYMELGDYNKAGDFLDKVKNNSDYNYLIRLAKWNDYKGDLETAIRFMEDAKNIAESRKSEPLMVWSYSNLADFYGHAGRIEDAYNYYLMTLKIQPDNAYAKKGIAWILYASENNSEEATRILDSIQKQHKIPDYFLLKAEMAEYNNDVQASEEYLRNFESAVINGNYGKMYNTYLIELYAESEPEKALALAKKELNNRATPEIYHLLAYAQLMSGDKEAALSTIETFVDGQTFEPMAQYHSALVYKANGLKDKVEVLKQELNGASFELGPVLSNKIKEL